MCVNNLPRVALDSGEASIRTRDLLIASLASNHSATEPHYVRNGDGYFQNDFIFYIFKTNYPPSLSLIGKITLICLFD